MQKYKSLKKRSVNLMRLSAFLFAHVRVVAVLSEALSDNEASNVTIRKVVRITDNTPSFHALEEKHAEAEEEKIIPENSEPLLKQENNASQQMVINVHTSNAETEKMNNDVEVTVESNDLKIASMEKYHIDVVEEDSVVAAIAPSENRLMESVKIPETSLNVTQGVRDLDGQVAPQSKSISKKIVKDRKKDKKRKQEETRENINDELDDKNRESDEKKRESDEQKHESEDVAEEDLKVYSGGIVWGNNHIGSHDLHPGHFEPSLQHLCDTRLDIDTIFIDGILAHSTPHYLPLTPALRKTFADVLPEGANGLFVPGLILGNHCNVRNRKLRLKKGALDSPLSLLDCGSIGEQIAHCQRGGKKIILNVTNKSAASVFRSQEDAERAAMLYFHLFLGGEAMLSERPFGRGVTLDGLNLVARDPSPYYADFLNKLAELKEKSDFELAVTTKCSFPDRFLGDILTDSISVIDRLVVEFTSSTECSFAKKDLFLSALRQWHDWIRDANPKLLLMIGLPAGKVGGIGAPGDFIALQDVPSLGQHIRSLPHISGICFTDYSTDNLNLPCLPQKQDDNDAMLLFKSYSQLFLAMLNQRLDTSRMEKQFQCTLRSQTDTDAYWQFPKGFVNSPDPAGPPVPITKEKDEPIQKKKIGKGEKDNGCGPGKKCFRPKGHKQKDVHASSAPITIGFLFFFLFAF